MSAYSVALRDQLMAQALQATEDLARPSWGVPVRTYADGLRDAVEAVKAACIFACTSDDICMDCVAAIAAIEALVDAP